MRSPRESRRALINVVVPQDLELLCRLFWYDSILERISLEFMIMSGEYFNIFCRTHEKLATAGWSMLTEHKQRLNGGRKKKR
jgi:hypothetical protein